ncbi:hypothetical protein ACN9MU_18520 [Pseudoduganella sp. R-32]|uniref:hypothetical protein n=1 Tax=Pseudoduganella sp. R-32 TaxID=3404061 RepID=UPI003CF4A296
MSQSMGVITPSSCGLKAIETILGDRWRVAWIQRQSGSSDLHIQQVNAESHAVYVSIAELDAGEAAQDYAECVGLSDVLRSSLVRSKFYLLSFNDFELAKSVMGTLLLHFRADLEETWIDNDYGQLISGSNFLRNITLDPNWDWRVV